MSIPWRRLDSRMIWVDAVRCVVSFLPTGVAVGVFGVELDPSSIWPLLVVAGLGVLGAIADALRWLKTRYRITEEYVELRTGLLVRKNRSVRRDRIRSVDTKAKLRHRLAGLRLVTIGAGQQAATGEAAFALDAVSKQTAAELRHELLGDEPISDERPASAGVPLARLRWSWLRYNIVNIWALLVAAGLLWGANWFLQTFGYNLSEIVSGLLDWERLGLGWSIAIGFAAAGALGGVGLACVFVSENWNFELARVPGENGTTLRTSQGLFTTRVVNRDENRLRGVAITEPLFWRWMHAADTEVISTGLSGGMNSASGILPRCSLGEARRVTAMVLGDDRPVAASLRAHPRAALRRRIGRAVLFSGFVVGLLALLPSVPWWAGLAVLPLGLGCAVLAYRALGHRLVDEHLVVRSGVLWRRTAVLRRQAVIGWKLRQSVPQRWLGLLTVSASTAAGAGIYEAFDADVDGALDFADCAVPGLLTPFLIEQEQGASTS